MLQRNDVLIDNTSQYTYIVRLKKTPHGSYFFVLILDESVELWVLRKHFMVFISWLKNSPLVWMQ